MFIFRAWATCGVTQIVEHYKSLTLKSTVLLFALDSAHVKLDIWNSPL